MQGISTKNISEHLPVVLANDKQLLILLAIYIAVIALTKVKIKLSDLFMIAGLVLLSIFTRRQSSMLYLIGALIFNRIIVQLLTIYVKEGVIEKIDELTSKIISIIIISVLVITISLFQYKKKIDNKFISESTYPVQAATWIKENLNVNEIKLYNEYNYGSYLIYRDIPVFIDSRCDLYLPEFNKNVEVFKDFLNMNNMNINNEQIEEKIEQYGFTHFIVLKKTRLKWYLDANSDKYIKIYPTEDIEDKNFVIYERVEK